MTRTKKPQGHYCYVCRRYRANEKFSGKGHARHICKDCARDQKAADHQRRCERREREQTAHENLQENDQITE